MVCAQVHHARAALGSVVRELDAVADTSGLPSRDASYRILSCPLPGTGSELPAFDLPSFPQDAQPMDPGSRCHSGPSACARPPSHQLQVPMHATSRPGKFWLSCSCQANSASSATTARLAAAPHVGHVAIPLLVMQSSAPAAIVAYPVMTVRQCGSSAAVLLQPAEGSWLPYARNADAHAGSIRERASSTHQRAARRIPSSSRGVPGGDDVQSLRRGCQNATS